MEKTRFDFHVAALEERPLIQNSVFYSVVFLKSSLLLSPSLLSVCAQQLSEDYTVTG